MGTPYTGVAGAAVGPASATVPADGDTDSAATFTVGTQKILDYLALLFPIAWVGATAYTLNQLRSNGANIYLCTNPGTPAASGGPTGTGTGIADNTVTWNFVATLAGNGIYSQASAAAPGLTGEGGATGPGVWAIAGGGGTPARGALALKPQTTPSAPANG